MELLPLLRLISRRRLAFGSGILVALVVFVGLGGTKPVNTSSAVASARVILDTPTSQLTDAAPSGADTLAWRASLMSHLMAASNSTAQVARKLGVGADQVTVVDPTLGQPLVPTDTAEAALKVAGNIFTPYVLTTYADGQVPMIWIDAVGATTPGATRLARAAVAVLESESSSGGNLNSLIPTGIGAHGLQPFRVEQVSPVSIELMPSSSLPTKPIAAAFVFFVAWCLATGLMLPRILRRLRPPDRALAA